MTEEIKNKLLPYQIHHTENLTYSLKTYGRACDVSDTGTGKSYTAIASILSLGYVPFIICPKSILSTWSNVVKHFNGKCYGYSNYETIQNCKYYINMNKQSKSICPYVDRIVKKKDKDTEYIYSWHKIPDDMVIIYDEVHRCKNSRTINHNILLALLQSECKILMLSATVCDKPENFALCGLALKLYKSIHDYTKWLDKISVGYESSSHAIHDEIFPEYCSRMRIRDMPKGLFPDNQILAECYDMDCAEEIQKQYEIIESEVEKLKKKEDSSGCALTRILYARMRIEQLKIPTMLELAKKYLKENLAVVIFVNFTGTLKTIAKELKTNCLIYGEQTLEQRNKNISDFNSDASHIIICNMRSGNCGISLGDTVGIFPRISIISPSWSATDIIQALGRIHRANTKTVSRQRILFCKGTIEEQICLNMKEKINNIAQLNDGDMLSYQIEGLTDKTEVQEVSEFELLMLRISTLNAKKERLNQELKETEQEIMTLTALVNEFIV